jgi:transcriptional regulator with XRE-family HTH domain
MAQRNLGFRAQALLSIKQEGLGVDMHINADFVKAERRRRAWSQEQLASAAGLGLRTIQRLEASGIASNETIKSLAAVFGCSVQDLRVADEASHAVWPLRRALPIATAASVALISGALLITRTWAGEVMLDVALGGADPNPKVFKLLTEEGRQTEARIEQQLRIVLTPTVTENDLILISAEIYGYDGQQYKLLSKPKVLTREGVDAKIQVKLSDGNDVQMSINPKKM